MQITRNRNRDRNRNRNRGNGANGGNSQRRLGEQVIELRLRSPTLALEFGEIVLLAK